MRQKKCTLVRIRNGDMDNLLYFLSYKLLCHIRYTNDVIKLIHISEKFTITQNFHIMICLFPLMFNLGQGQTSFENINFTLETIRFACLKTSFIV